MGSDVFIFHGTGGDPQENWFPWLKEKLEVLGCKVIVPKFPTPVGQSLEAWLKILEPYRHQINSDTILIGHSLGGIFTLKLLERLERPIKLAILVGTPIGIRPILNFDLDEKFASFIFDWRKIKQNAKNFIVYQSDNDPYVGLENGKELAKHLGIRLIFVPNSGHFNAKAGYTKFDDLLNQLKNYL
ncbi:MAG: serine hydrolase family protein [Candidatus Doudnabacteria bacterium]|nr:serine hydrolase family protein [Candidatus Doudnabacteria bacterium]